MGVLAASFRTWIYHFLERLVLVDESLGSVSQAYKLNLPETGALDLLQYVTKILANRMSKSKDN